MRDIGLSPKSWTNRVMVGEALARGLTILPSENRWILIRHPDGREYTWGGGFTSFNAPLSQRVTRHKDVNSRLLTAYDVAATENAVFSHGDEDRAWHWAEKFGVIVVKPVDGTHGNHVHVGIRTRDEFIAAFQDVARSSSGRVLVEKFYSGVEHRCLAVDGRLVAATRRRPASVRGDGLTTVADLVAAKNTNRYPIHSPLELDDEACMLLDEVGMTVDSVVPAGERVSLRRASNIHQGGDAIDATDDLRPEEVDLVERAVRAIPGMRLVGMDVLLPRNPGDSSARVLEMNAGPMITMHHYPWEGQSRNVAGAILDAMFPPASAPASSLPSHAGPGRVGDDDAVESKRDGSPSLLAKARRKLRTVIPSQTSAPAAKSAAPAAVELRGLRFDILGDHAKLSATTAEMPTTVTIPDLVEGVPVTIIGRGAFSGQTALTAVSIPPSVTTLGAEAFRGCESLNSIELPADLEVINAKAFEGCAALRTVHLPHRLRRIASHAFSGCSTLEELPHFVWSGPREGGALLRTLVESSLPVTLEYLGEGAFADCTSLTAAVIPHQVTTIKASVFEGCASLEHVWLHARLTAIGDRAFHGCTSLDRVRIPTDTTIGAQAFAPTTVLVSRAGSPAHDYAAANGNRAVTGTLPSAPITTAFGADDGLSAADVLADDSLLQGFLDEYALRPPTVEWTRGATPSDVASPSRFALDDGVYRQRDATPGTDVTLLMVGDLMCGFRQQRSALRDDVFDFSATFEHVKPILDSGHLTMGNLEAMFASSYPLMKDRLYVDDRPHLNAPVDYLNAIRGGGFDLVLNAQNHMYDTGPKGVLETLAALNNAELVHGGLYADPNEPRYLLFEIHGMRIAVVAYLDPARQRMKQAAFTPEALAAMASPFDADRIAADTAAARAAGAEYVLAYCHWGREYTDEISARQARFAQMVADNGADYIFGSHSHCPQRYDVLSTQDGRDVPVVYSGGNFVADIERHPPITSDAFIASLTLTRAADGRVVIKEDGYLPCRIVADPAVIRGHSAVVPTELLQQGRFGYDPEVATDDIRRLGDVLGPRYRRLALAELSPSSDTAP
ncbi:MAG: CapA family protein [Actinomycetota bacterium]